MEEAPHHPHNVARGSFVEVDGVMQPAAAPRFSRTPAARPTPPEEVGADTRVVLRGWDIPEHKIEALLASGVLGEPQAQAFAERSERDTKAAR
jgi:alpha-methylacyl-CoA racemase